MRTTQRVLVLLSVLALGVLIHALQPILFPFLTGALLAYLTNPLVTALTRFGLSRVVAVSSAFLVLTLVTTLALILLLPMLWEQLVFLQSRLPSALLWMNQQGIPWLEERLRIDVVRLDKEAIMTYLNTWWQTREASSTQLLSGLAASGLSVLATLGLVALIPVVTFYLLLDWEETLLKLRRLLPRRYEQEWLRLIRECDDVLAAFLRGQLMVMIALGLIYGIGLQIVGLKLALVIGLVAGLASIIPYVGFVVGIVTATIVALFQFGLEWQPILLVWLVFGVGQLLEGWVLQPWLVGDRIGLPPVGVIFAIMAGGQLFGFVGMLLALPVAAILVVLLRYAEQRYVASQFYTGRSGDAASHD